MAEKPSRSPAEWVRQFAIALDLPFVMVSAVLGGGIVGYVLDQYLHTAPWLMLVCGGLGFVAGLRGVLQSLARRSGNPPGARGGGDNDGQGGGERR